MPYEVSFFHSYSIVIDADGSGAARLVNQLSGSGVDLLAFTERRLDAGKSLLSLLAADGAALSHAARKLGRDLRENGAAILVRGGNWPAPMTDAMSRLSSAQIEIAGAEAVSSGAGNFEGLIWIGPEELDRAAGVLDRSISPFDLVEESSLESFPASDPPSWAMG